jgi:hypothetical protein
MAMSVFLRMEGEKDGRREGWKERRMEGEKDGRMEGEDEYPGAFSPT